VTALTHGEMWDHAPTRELSGQLVAEGLAVAQALGIELEDDPLTLIAEGARINYRHRPSMLQDVLARRPTEIEMLNGGIVREGSAHGVATPCTPPFTRSSPVCRTRGATHEAIDHVLAVDINGTMWMVPDQNTDDVYERVRGAILDGELAAGTVMSQVALAEELGISRTPLREALRLLQGEGLIEAEPNRRVRVAPMTASDMEELCVMCVTLEAEALRLSAPMLTPQDLARLEGVMAEMAHFAQVKDYRRWVVPHRDFYRALTAPAGPRTNLLLGQLFDHSERYRRLHIGSGRPPATARSSMPARPATASAVLRCWPVIWPARGSRSSSCSSPTMTPPGREPPSATPAGRCPPRGLPRRAAAALPPEPGLRPAGVMEDRRQVERARARRRGGPASSIARSWRRSGCRCRRPSRRTRTTGPAAVRCRPRGRSPSGPRPPTDTRRGG
jgi:DNA-binding GntR family transcriptional regulator